MPKRKVLIILGSPRRKGNSALLAGRAAKAAVAAGAAVESVYLHGLTIKPCSACDWCQRHKGMGCVIKDDMQPLYHELRAADSIIIAGPVYWFSVSAQTKLFMDRCYALGADPGGNALKGKRIGIILTYGDEDVFGSGGVNALRMFQDAFGYIEAPIAGVVHASAGAAGAVAKDRVAMNKAAALGRELAS
jgi:multimeric flavodoxin WrbA